MDPASLGNPRPDDVRSPRGGIVRAARRPPGWVPPGPAPQPPKSEDVDPLWPGPEEDLCWLAGDWRILQRIDGHRFSLDDLLTAHTAVTCFAGRPPPSRILDLGCGIGSVLLFCSWAFPEARSLGIEVQPLSAGMARRSIAWNGVDDRCQVVSGDFRDPHTTAGLGPFELVTGTPPYFPPGTGLESDHVQRGPCRFEHHGGVEAYVAAAAPLLAPGAPLVLCAAPGQITRLERAAPEAGLHLERRRDLVPRTGKAPLFSVFVLRAGSPSGPVIIEPALEARDAQGERTPALRALRAAMGMP